MERFIANCLIETHQKRQIVKKVTGKGFVKP